MNREGVCVIRWGWIRCLHLLPPLAVPSSCLNEGSVLPLPALLLENHFLLLPLGCLGGVQRSRNKPLGFPLSSHLQYPLADDVVGSGKHGASNLLLHEFAKFDSCSS